MSQKIRYKNKNTFRIKIALAGIFLLSIFFVSAVSSQGAVNRMINYQGKLTGTNGFAVADGNYDMIFKIYDDPTSGTLLWTGTHTASNGNPIALSRGIFSTLLGSGTGNTLSLDFTSDTYYLQVEIYNTNTSGWETFNNRKRIGAVPQAINSLNLAGNGYLDIDNTATAQDAVNVNYNPATGANDAVEIAYGSAGGTGTALKVTQSGTGKILELFDNTTSVMSVVDGGYVGIGTTAPTQVLDVAGNIHLGASVDDLTTRNIYLASNRYISLVSGGLNITNWYGTGLGSFSHTFGFNGDTNLAIYDNGTVYVGNGSNSTQPLMLKGDVSGENSVGSRQHQWGVDTRDLRIYTSDPYANSGQTLDAGNIILQTGTGTNGGTTGIIKFEIGASGTEKMRIDGNGKVGIGTTDPTARLHIGIGGTTTAGTAPLKLTSGTAMTNPEDGAMEYHSSHLYFTIGSTRYQIDQQSSGSLPSGTEGQTLYNNGGTWTAHSGIFWDDGNSRLGIGMTIPTATLHLVSSTTSGDVPLKFSSGLNSSSPEDGAMEYDGANLYFTIGSTRYQIDRQIPTGTEGQTLYNNGGTWTAHSGIFWDDGNSRLGIGMTIPTATLHLVSSTTSGDVPLKFSSGLNSSSPEDGAMEYDGGHLYFTIGSTRYQLDQQSGGSLPSGTEGQMMYNNAGSWTAFSGMIWNDTNNFLGIGAATPLAKFHSGMDISDYSTYSFANTGAVITSIGVDQDDARSNALTLMRDGTSGVVYAGAAAFDLSQWESSSTNTRMQMDIRLSHSDTNTLTDVMSLRSNGNVGISNTAPTARLHLAAGTATAGTAPLKLTSGTALGTPEDGAMEYHSSHLYFTIGSTRYQLDQQGGGSIWTDGSGISYLTDLNEDLAIGGTSLTSPFSIDVSSNTVRIGSGSGSNGILNIFASDGDYLRLTHDGTNASITSSSGNVEIGSTGDLTLASGVNLVTEGNLEIKGDSTSRTITLGDTGKANDDTVNIDALNWTMTSNTLSLGSGSTTNSIINMLASDGDTGSLTYNTTDSWAFEGGNVGIGTTAPTARLHLTSGTATAGTAPLKLTSGTALGTPEDGAMEYHSSHLYFTIGSTRYQLDQQSAGSSTLQGAYDATSGNTITTTTGRNVIFTLAELATATSVTIENQDTAGDSAEKITNSIASGTLTNGLLFEQTGAGTVTNAISILETAGTVSTAINIGNNVGTGISIGTGLTTGISVGSGGITIASGTAYTGSGTVTLSSGSASGLTIDSGTTGAIDIGTGANAKTITVGNSTGATAVNINAGTGGINFEAAGTGTTDSIQVGAGGAGSETPDLLGLDVKSNTGNPAGFEGAMYYNTSDNKFRCYEKDRWRDCIDYTTPYAPYYVSGEYYNQAVNGLAKTTIAGAANRMDISPFAPQVDFTVASFAIDVTTSVASSNVRIVVYASNETTKLPSDRLLQSGDLSGATTGMKTYTPGSAFTFEAGKYYWVGVHHSSTATLRGINVGALAPLGTPSAAGTTQNTILRRSSVTYGTSSPDPFGTGTSTSAIMPEIKMLAN